MKIAMFLGDSETKRGKGLKSTPSGLELMSPE